MAKRKGRPRKDSVTLKITRMGRNKFVYKLEGMSISDLSVDESFVTVPYPLELMIGGSVTFGLPRRPKRPKELMLWPEHQKG